MLGTEVFEPDVWIGDQVIGNRENTVADGDAGPLRAATAADVAVLSGQVGLLGARFCPAGSTSAALNQLLPCRVRPLSLVPALSRLLDKFDPIAHSIR